MIYKIFIKKQTNSQKKNLYSHSLIFIAKNNDIISLEMYVHKKKKHLLIRIYF